MPALDRFAAEYLTRRYAVALGLVAVLALISQLVIQHALARQQPDSQVVNLAGRQRMLSQRLCKAALLAERDPAAAAERDATLAAWTAAHERLIRGHEPGMGDRNPADIAAMLTAADPLVLGMAQAVRDNDLAGLLAREREFLERMDAIVARYGEHAAERVRQLSRLEWMLLAVTIAVLALEAWLVFAPAVRRLRAALAERERLVEQELELQVAKAGEKAAADIGCDLHDGLGQQLTGLALQAKALARRLDSHPEADAAQQLSAGADLAIRQARGLARRLAPVELAKGGLPDALRQLCADTAVAFSVACTAQVEEGLTLADPDAEQHVFRIAQEAVTNALRHAKAKRIWVTLARDGSLVRLVVRDDGRGIPAGAPEGFGLRSLRLRARRIGAQLSIDGTPAHGTEVVVTWSHGAG
ncbi:MAG: histidine kinase [Planctomycetota bacterium]|jgi:signal transduction histidine kinase